MGGKSSKQTVGYKFYAGAAITLATFVSKLRKIKFTGKVAWEGASEGGEISINKPRLFGTKIEGGVVGTFVFRRGDATQMPDPYFIDKKGTSQLPAQRGVAQLVFRQPYLGNNPYIKELECIGERVNELDTGEVQWYPAKAAIGRGGEATVTVFDYTATNWRYKTEAPAENGDYSAKNYDDSGWGLGQGGVGNYGPGYGTPPANTIVFGGASPVAAHSKIWIRRTISSIPDGAYLRVDVYKDDYANLYLNGDEIPLIQDPLDWFHAYAEVPPLSGLTGENVVALRVEDSLGGGNPTYIYAAMKLSYFVPSLYELNPAHIIRECLTDKRWGYGYSDSEINDTVFQSAADALYNESFGLSYFWNDNSELDTVIDKVLDHIDGNLFVDPATLTWKLTLNRNDYDAATLPELRLSHEVVSVSNYKKPQFMELVNQVRVNYYDLLSEGNAHIIANNPALFLQQGKLISKEIDYPMCSDATLAARLAQRDLEIYSNPLSSCEIEVVYSAAKDLQRGSVFKLTAAPYDYNQTVMRVVEINRGNGEGKTIRLEVAEDRFTLPEAQVGTSQPGSSTPVAPTALTNRLVIEEPYAMMIRRSSQLEVNELLSKSPDVGFLSVAAARNQAALYADIYVDDGAGYANQARLDFCPFGTLQGAISYLDSSFTLENLSDIDSIDDEVLFQIDNEIMALGSLNKTTGAVTGVRRGVFDTVPATHAAGAKAFFIDSYLDGSDKQYVEGESLNVKLLTVTTAGTLTVSSAPADSLTFQGRALRPYPPGQFKIAGSYYPTSTISNTFNVTWAHRDRSAQADQIVDTTQAALTLPANQRYGLRFENAATDALLVERTDIGPGTASVALNFTGNVRCKLWAISNDGVSLQMHNFVFDYTGTTGNTITATAYTPVDDATIIDGGGD